MLIWGCGEKNEINSLDSIKLNEQIIPEWQEDLEFNGVPEAANKKKVRISILDSGINYLHEDLNGKVVKSYNAIDEGQPISDVAGHGTAIAGIIAANDNRKGIIGVFPNVELYDVKVLDDEGKGGVESIVKGIYWSIEENVDIINLSFGLQSDNKMLREAVEEALSAGIILVAAAGNTYSLGTDYPAAYEGVYSITAVDKNFQRLSSSAKGKIDFAAPGENVLSTNHLGEYSYYTGTSFATAYATGIIAIFLSEFEQPELIFEKVKEAALTLEDKNSYGYGLLKLY